MHDRRPCSLSRSCIEAGIAMAAVVTGWRRVTERHGILPLIVAAMVGLSAEGLAALPAEAQGHADREAFETWISGLNAEQRQGAEAWAAERSKPKPTSCDTLTKVGPDKLLGCREAQRRLADFDARRKAEPDYRKGWNAPLVDAEAMSLPQLPDPIQPRFLPPTAMTCNQQFSAMLDEAAEKGMSPASVVGMFRSLVSFVQDEQRNAGMVTSDSAIGYLAVWQALSSQRLSDEGIASIIMAVDKSIRHGGAMGMASAATSYRAMQAHGVTDPYTMQRLQSRGAFALLPDGTFLIVAQVNEVVREMAGLGPNRTDNAGSNHLGVTMDQFQVLRSRLRESDATRFARDHPITAAYLKQCLASVMSSPE